MIISKKVIAKISEPFFVQKRVEREALFEYQHGIYCYCPMYSASMQIELNWKDEPQKMKAVKYCNYTGVLQYRQYHAQVNSRDTRARGSGGQGASTCQINTSCRSNAFLYLDNQLYRTMKWEKIFKYTGKSTRKVCINSQWSQTFTKTCAQAQNTFSSNSFIVKL